MNIQEKPLFGGEKVYKENKKSNDFSKTD